MLRMEREKEAMRIQREEDERRRLLKEEKDRLLSEVPRPQPRRIVEPSSPNDHHPSIVNAVYPTNEVPHYETTAAAKYWLKILVF